MRALSYLFSILLCDIAPAQAAVGEWVVDKKRRVRLILKPEAGHVVLVPRITSMRCARLRLECHSRSMPPIPALSLRLFFLKAALGGATAFSPIRLHHLETKVKCATEGD
jgi:hypothetical protein